MDQKTMKPDWVDPDLPSSPAVFFNFRQDWLITENALQSLIDHASAAEQLNPQPQDYLRRRYAMETGGIALIQIKGGMTKTPHPFRAFLGTGVSYTEITRMVADAVEDPNVKAVLLDIDSPGGTVDGAFECAKSIAWANDKKPVYAYANGQTTSAGYLLAASAKHIQAGITAQLGSIGVVTVHADFSKFEEEMGVKHTFLTAGDHKALGNPSEPLSDKARADIQSRLDTLYKLFTTTISKRRGLDLDMAKAVWADGRVFLAQEAFERGLADGVGGDLSEYISFILKKESLIMDLKQFKAEYPGLSAEFRAEIEAEIRASAEAGTAQAVAEAENNCLGLIKSVAGEEIYSKVKAFMSANFSTAQLEVLKAAGISFDAMPPSAPADDPAEAQKAAMLDALKNAGNDPLNAAPPNGDEAKGFDALVDECMTRDGIKKSEAQTKVRQAHPDKFQKWLDAQQVK